MEKHDQENIQDLQNLLSELENFESQVSELKMMGKMLTRKMQKHPGSVSQQGQQLDLYFNNRLGSFLEENEMFKFGYARESIEEEIECIKQDVTEDEEED